MSEFGPQSFVLPEQSLEYIDQHIEAAGFVLANQVADNEGVIGHAHYLRRVLGDRLLTSVHVLATKAYPSYERLTTSESANAIETGLIIGAGLSKTFKDNANHVFEREFAADVYNVYRIIKGPQDNGFLRRSLERRSDPLVARLLNTLPDNMFNPFIDPRVPRFSDAHNDLYARAMSYGFAAVGAHVLRQTMLQWCPADRKIACEMALQAYHLSGSDTLDTSILD